MNQKILIHLMIITCISIFSVSNIITELMLLFTGDYISLCDLELACWQGTYAGTSNSPCCSLVEYKTDSSNSYNGLHCRVRSSRVRSFFFLKKYWYNKYTKLWSKHLKQTVENQMMKSACWIKILLNSWCNLKMLCYIQYTNVLTKLLVHITEVKLHKSPNSVFSQG